MKIREVRRATPAGQDRAAARATSIYPITATSARGVDPAALHQKRPLKTRPLAITSKL